MFSGSQLIIAVGPSFSIEGGSRPRSAPGARPRNPACAPAGQAGPGSARPPDSLLLQLERDLGVLPGLDLDLLGLLAEYRVHHFHLVLARGHVLELERAVAVGDRRGVLG